MTFQHSSHDPDRTEPFYFSAVPVNIRMKKIADASKRPRNSINISSTSLSSSAKKKTNKNCQPKFTSLRLRNKKALNDDEDLEAVIEAVQLQESDADNVKENSVIPSQTDLLHDIPQGRSSALKGILSRSVSNKSYSENESIKNNIKPKATTARHFPTGNKDIRDKQIQENEQLIKDLLSKTQPYHDHCYTTMFGKKNGIDKMSLQNSDDESNFDESTGPIIYNCKLEPILSLPSVRSTIDMPMVCSEEVVGDVICEAEGDKHDGFSKFIPDAYCFMSSNKDLK
ncbi:hypothetical protein LOTGIDRAFT_155068 [Lottia gigantea]|uniref:Uncharacterized protein n=1 Tax=Lottia gigantea TaxID=225164 RepID=V3ZSM8_LOTGI|nr:hypothetical protein LOTGIDRAFT_155068 [Lottia gigantea]ESO85580.1 hypothetical protein LOTGIDRAFT_155068 [Lottia gigantea]